MAAKFQENWSPLALGGSWNSPGVVTLLKDDEFLEEAITNQPLSFVKNVLSGLTTQRMLLCRFHIIESHSLGLLACNKLHLRRVLEPLAICRFRCFRKR